MLVLTRKPGEAVCVGQDVEIFVVGVSRGKVKLGFRAPREVAVQRAEVAARTHANSVETASEHPVLARMDCDEPTANPPLRVLQTVGGTGA